MASRQHIILIDDFDGTEITDGGETIRFALDGLTYEIDLTAANAQALRALLAPYVQHGRRTSRRATRAAGRGQASVDREQSKAARAWLRSRGHQVSDKGRIKAKLMEVYLTNAGQ